MADASTEHAARSGLSAAGTHVQSDVIKIGILPRLFKPITITSQLRYHCR